MVYKLLKVYFIVLNYYNVLSLDNSINFFYDKWIFLDCLFISLFFVGRLFIKYFVSMEFFK